MTTRRRWFDRRFQLGLPAEALPDLLERLRGTPARLEERTRGVSVQRLTMRHADAWSIQENVGHMLDLEPLWAGRLEDFLNGTSQLRATDLANRGTWDADHNQRALDLLLTAFRSARTSFVSRLEAIAGDRLHSTAMHPRLLQPMTIADHCFFVAEHDDHHLARISELIRYDAG